jgi:hypothetical protein
MLDLPVLVRRVVMPALYAVGNVLGKYRKYADAPAPIPADRQRRA